MQVICNLSLQVVQPFEASEPILAFVSSSFPSLPRPVFETLISLFPKPFHTVSPLLLDPHVAYGIGEIIFLNCHLEIFISFLISTQMIIPSQLLKRLAFWQRGCLVHGPDGLTIRNESLRISPSMFHGRVARFFLVLLELLLSFVECFHFQPWGWDAIGALAVL